MPVSIPYTKLTNRIKELKKQFLGFDQIDSPEPKNQDNLRAFKLLMHAEIESYIEIAVFEVWKKCSDEWTKNKKVLPALAFLIMYSSIKFEANDKQLNKDARIDQILNSYKALIESNNGIKTKNILLLAIPLGITYDDIDSTWLYTMNSYGTYRGLVAHKSFSVQKQIDKEDELNNIKIIRNGLRDLDLKLQKLTSTLKMPY